MKVLLLVMLSLSCLPDNYPRDSKGRLEENNSFEVCRHGVVYYRDSVSSTYSYSPKFLPNSKVETCK